MRDWVSGVRGREAAGYRRRRVLMLMWVSRTAARRPTSTRSRASGTAAPALTLTLVHRSIATPTRISRTPQPSVISHARRRGWGLLLSGIGTSLTVMHHGPAHARPSRGRGLGVRATRSVVAGDPAGEWKWEESVVDVQAALVVGGVLH